MRGIHTNPLLRKNLLLINKVSQNAILQNKDLLEFHQRSIYSDDGLTKLRK